jgi:hypothetical protein
MNEIGNVKAKYSDSSSQTICSIISTNVGPCDDSARQDAQNHREKESRMKTNGGIVNKGRNDICKKSFRRQARKYISNSKDAMKISNNVSFRSDWKVARFLERIFALD